MRIPILNFEFPSSTELSSAEATSRLYDPLANMYYVSLISSDRTYMSFFTVDLLKQQIVSWFYLGGLQPTSFTIDRR